MTIPDYRLPEHIEKGSQFSPTLQNVIQESISGVEQRFAQWTKCRGTGDVSYGLQNSTDPDGDFHVIIALYRAHYGSLLPFRFKDWSDFKVEDEPFGNGNGVKTAFQLIKTYDPSNLLLGIPGSVLYVREITLLASAPVIKVDGVTMTAITDYNISSSGIVTFTTPPAVDKLATWTGEFDVPVRFDGQLQIIMNESDIVAIGSLPIKEVIGEG